MVTQVQNLYASGSNESCLIIDDYLILQHINCINEPKISRIMPNYNANVYPCHCKCQYNRSGAYNISLRRLYAPE